VVSGNRPETGHKPARALGGGSWGNNGQKEADRRTSCRKPKGDKGKGCPGALGGVGREADRRPERAVGVLGGWEWVVAGLFQQAFQHPVGSAFCPGFRGPLHFI
jgi:hypothetical protein